MAVANARIARSRNFSIFAIGDVLSTVLSATAGICAALLGLGVWSLVIQQLILWLTKAAWLVPTSKFRPQFMCNLNLARPYLHFGINSAAANLSDIIGKSLPPLVVGGTLGVTPLGHYSMAYQLTRVPDQVISGPIYLTTLTAVARADRDRAGPLVLRSLRIMVATLAFLFCGLALTADLATDLLLGPKWADTAPVLAALAPAGFLLCLYSFMGAVLLGLGNSPRQLTLSLLSGVAIFIGCVRGNTVRHRRCGNRRQSRSGGDGACLSAVAIERAWTLRLVHRVQHRCAVDSSGRDGSHRSRRPSGDFALSRPCCN